MKRFRGSRAAKSLSFLKTGTQAGRVAVLGVRGCDVLSARQARAGTALCHRIRGRPHEGRGGCYPRPWRRHQHHQSHRRWHNLRLVTEPTGLLIQGLQDAIKAQIGLLTAVYIEAGEVAPSFTGQALKSESAATSADTKNADLKKFDRVPYALNNPVNSYFFGSEAF